MKVIKKCMAVVLSLCIMVGVFGGISANAAMLFSTNVTLIPSEGGGSASGSFTLPPNHLTSPNETFTFSENQTRNVGFGSTLSFTPHPNSGWEFYRWTINGSPDFDANLFIVGANNVLTIEGLSNTHSGSNLSVRAYFQPVPPPPAFHPPNGLTLGDSTGDGYLLSWNPVPGASGYRVYVNNTPVATLNGNGNTSHRIPHTNLEQSNNYITVRAIRTSGSDSGHSEHLRYNPTQPQIRPLNPPVIQGGLGTNYVLTWNSSNAAGTQYRVYVNGIPVANTVTGNTFTLPTNSLATPGTYIIQVRAVANASSLFTDSSLSATLTHVVNATPTPTNTVTLRTRLASVTGQGGPFQILERQFAAGETVNIYAPARQGYTFAGWVPYAPSSGITFENPYLRATSFTMPNAPVTIIATWTQVTTPPRPVIINHTPTGTTSINGSLPTSGDTHTVGDSVTLVPGTRTGYQFVGWFSHDVHISPVTDTNHGTFTMPNSTVSVIGQWRRDADPVATVTINLGLGTTTPPVVMEGISGGAMVPISAHREGYRFTGWTTDPLGLQTRINHVGSPIAAFHMPTPPVNVTITANWEQLAPNHFTVTLLNSSHWEGAPGPNTPLAQQGITTPYAITTGVIAGTPIHIQPGNRAGYTFNGWSSVPHVDISGGIGAQSFPMPAANVVLTANWTQNAAARGTVNIDNRIINTEDVPNGRIDLQTTSGRSHVRGVDYVTVNAGTIEGFYFVRWQVAPANALTLANRYNSVQTFLMPDLEAVTLTALWRAVPIGTHSVSINNTPPIRTGTTPPEPHPVQGVRSQLGNGTWDSGVTHVIGERVTVHTAARPGYTFTGWTVTPAFLTTSLSESQATPPTGTWASVTSFIMPDQAVTITANWVRNDIPQLYTPVVALTGSTITWPAIPNATGYRIYVNGQEVASVTSTTLSFNLNHLTPPLGVGTHLVQVRAIGNGTTHIDSNQSVARSFVIIPPVTPESIRPTGLSIVNSTLRWNPVMNADRYYIYVNGSRRTTIHNAATANFSPTNPSFDLATLNNPRLTVGGSGYDIQVRAVVGTVTSHLSEVRRFTEARPPLPPPTNVRITGNPTLNWDFPSGHADLIGFRIYVNGQASGHMVGPTVRSFPIANLGLTSGSYLIGVRAVGAGVAYSDSYISTFVQYTSSTLPALNTPIGLSISGHTLSWNAVPNAVGYRIYVNGQASTAGIVGGLSFNLSSLNLGAGTHLIQVRALGNNTTHVDSPISAFVSYVLNTGQVAGANNPSNSNSLARTNQYVVTFNAGAGSFPAGEDGLRMGPSGFVINSFTNVPTRAGYTFGGWSIGGTPVSLPLTVSGDMTLNAIWNRVAATASPSPTPAPAGNRPNPQTGAFGLLNIMGVLVLTVGGIVTVKMLNRKKAEK